MSVTSKLPIHPFEDERYMGTVTRVLPSSVHVNLPLAGNTAGKIHHGQRIGGGEVGEFVLIECSDCGLFGRVLEVRLPERERLQVEEELGKSKEVHPVGVIQLLATISLTGKKPVAGVSRYPRLGDQVYSAHPKLVRWVIRRTQAKAITDEGVTLHFGTLSNIEGAGVEFIPEQLFGRHCAILGSTGGGKSWTIAHLISETLSHRSKIILLDATGEFRTLEEEHVLHVDLGGEKEVLPVHIIENGQVQDVNPLGRPDAPIPVDFPYTFLTEEDLFAIFTPSLQSQAPKLREAIKSLKLARLEESISTGGFLIKSGRNRREYEEAYRKHVQNIEKPQADFDISALCQQIEYECIWPTDRNSPAKWGLSNESERAYCVSLQLRIASIINAKGLRCVFQPSSGRQTVPSVISEFLQSPQYRVLRITMERIPFANSAREIVVNAMGRHLLEMARECHFRNDPLIVFLDEAHQFLNKRIGSDELRTSLDAFGLIAKEGRKYGLCVCIATQRPRDIPEDVLSQMGTLIVHRLINARDREIVEKASGEIDRSAAAFIPTLGPGEAIVVGVDFPVPFSVKVGWPRFEPASEGPNLQESWSREDDEDDILF